MHHLQYKGVDIYVVEEGEEYEAEPFAITVRVSKKDNVYMSHAVCNSLPCRSCPLLDYCKSGTNLNTYLALQLKEIAPELFI